VGVKTPAPRIVSVGFAAIANTWTARISCAAKTPPPPPPAIRRIPSFSALCRTPQRVAKSLSIQADFRAPAQNRKALSTPLAALCICLRAYAKSAHWRIQAQRVEKQVKYFFTPIALRQVF